MSLSLSVSESVDGGGWGVRFLRLQEPNVNSAAFSHTHTNKRSTGVTVGAVTRSNDRVVGGTQGGG